MHIWEIVIYTRTRGYTKESVHDKIQTLFELSICLAGSVHNKLSVSNTDLFFTLKSLFSLR